MHAQGKGIAQLRNEKQKMLKDVYRILAMNLGEPPAEFVWRHEPAEDDDEDEEEEKDDDEENEDADEEDDEPSYLKMRTTPSKFFADFVNVDMSDWVNIFNDTTHPYGKNYTVTMSRNMSDGQDINYANVDIETLKEIAIKALLDGKPVMFACDVGPDQNSTEGIMALGLYDYESIYGIDMEMSKADRAMYRMSVRSHGMVLVGVDLADEMPLKWRVENSWGSDKGDSGYWAMYDDWFDLHVYNIIVHKEYVPAKVLEIFEQKPTILPPWDPMM